MEYNKELIEKIYESLREDGYNNVCAVIDSHMIKFLEPELPICGFCGGKITVFDFLQNDWKWGCKKCTARSYRTYPTKQEAVNAYLATPFGKLVKGEN